MKKIDFIITKTLESPSQPMSSDDDDGEFYFDPEQAREDEERLREIRAKQARALTSGEGPSGEAQVIESQDSIPELNPVQDDEPTDMSFEERVLYNLHKIREKLNQLDARMTALEALGMSAKPAQTTGEQERRPRIELKTPIELDQKIITEAFKMTSPHLCELRIFRAFFMTGRLPPLKRNGSKCYFWENNDWKEVSQRDLAAKVGGILRMYLTAHNSISIGGLDVFKQVQEKISNLSTEKYQRELLNRIFAELV